MTMEQGRRLALLERRLDALDRARRDDREVLLRAINRQAETIHRLRCAVTDLEREAGARVEQQLDLELGA